MRIHLIEKGCGAFLIFFTVGGTQDEFRSGKDEKWQAEQRNVFYTDWLESSIEVCKKQQQNLLSLYKWCAWIKSVNNKIRFWSQHFFTTLWDYRWIQIMATVLNTPSVTNKPWWVSLGLPLPRACAKCDGHACPTANHRTRHPVSRGGMVSSWQHTCTLAWILCFTMRFSAVAC